MIDINKNPDKNDNNNDNCYFYYYYWNIFNKLQSYWIVSSKMIDRTETKPRPFNPLYPENLSSYSPQWSIHFFYVAEEENLFDNQELLKLVIISFIFEPQGFDCWGLALLTVFICNCRLYWMWFYKISLGHRNNSPSLFAYSE